MLEHAEVFGNLYGTPRAPVEAAIGRGRGRALRRRLAGRPADPQLVACATPWSRSSSCRRRSRELESRLRARGQDTDEVVAERMAKSRDEISHWAEYDYVLVNENLKQCEEELRAIIAAERLRRDRRPGADGPGAAAERGIRGAADMSLYALDGVAPELPADGDFWVAPGARLSGRVVLEKGASVWFNAVLRGDNEPIVVGAGSNVQDGCVCHTDHRLSADHRRRLHHRPHGDPARLHHRRGQPRRHGRDGAQRRGDRAGACWSAPARSSPRARRSPTACWWSAGRARWCAA